MAKKLYALPLKQLLDFIKENKSEIYKLDKDAKYKEYGVILGKSYYILYIEEFLHKFKIEKDIDMFLKMMKYFNSNSFIDEIFHLLNFKPFKIQPKEFFYGFVFVLQSKNRVLFEKFFEATFIHFSSFVNQNSNITINYKDIVTFLAKQRNLEVKESFGELANTDMVYFKLSVGDEIIIKNGKSIKVLRKKAYKQMLDKII